MSIQKIADSLKPLTPVIQWGAVSQKWHVTFADWEDDVYTGDTILLALQAAQQSVQRTGLTCPPNQTVLTARPAADAKS
jgi:hypothetical protein